MAVSGTDLLWGCPQMNFKANPPFNEMRQGFATFKKETRMAQYLPGLFENLRKKVIRDPGQMHPIFSSDPKFWLFPRPFHAKIFAGLPRIAFFPFRGIL